MPDARGSRHSPRAAPSPNGAPDAAASAPPQEAAPSVPRPDPVAPLRALDRAVSRVIEARHRRRKAKDPAAVEPMIDQAERELQKIAEDLQIWSLAQKRAAAQDASDSSEAKPGDGQDEEQ